MQARVRGYTIQQPRPASPARPAAPWPPTRTETKEIRRRTDPNPLPLNAPPPGGRIAVGATTDQGRHVALEIVRPKDSSFFRAKADSILRRARLLVSANVPGVVPIIEAFDDEGLLFFVMGYVRGVALPEVLNRNVLSGAEIVSLGVDLAATLSSLHALGIHVVELRCEHAMIDREGRILTAAPLFNLADEALDNWPRPPDELVGRVAPEVAAGAAPSPVSDQYALGCLLSEIVARTPKMNGGNFDRSLQNRQPPLALVEVLTRMTSPRPEGRYSSLEVCQEVLLSTAPQLLLAARAEHEDFMRWEPSEERKETEPREPSDLDLDLDSAEKIFKTVPLPFLEPIDEHPVEEHPSEAIALVRHALRIHALEQLEKLEVTSRTERPAFWDESLDAEESRLFHDDGGSAWASPEAIAASRNTERAFAHAEPSGAEAFEFFRSTDSSPVWSSSADLDGTPPEPSEATLQALPSVSSHFHDEETGPGRTAPMMASFPGPREQPDAADGKGEKLRTTPTSNAAAHQEQVPLGIDRHPSAYTAAAVMFAGFLTLFGLGTLFPSEQPAKLHESEEIILLSREVLQAGAPLSVYSRSTRPSPAALDAATVLHREARVRLQAGRIEEAEALLLQCIEIADLAKCHHTAAALLALSERPSVEVHLSKSRSTPQISGQR